jgi:hypothetical protein
MDCPSLRQRSNVKIRSEVDWGGNGWLVVHGSMFAKEDDFSRPRTGTPLGWKQDEPSSRSVRYDVSCVLVHWLKVWMFGGGLLSRAAGSLSDSVLDNRPHEQGSVSWGCLVLHWRRGEEW